MRAEPRGLVFKKPFELQLLSESLWDGWSWTVLCKTQSGPKTQSQAHWRKTGAVLVNAIGCHRPAQSHHQGTALPYTTLRAMRTLTLHGSAHCFFEVQRGLSRKASSEIDSAEAGEANRMPSTAGGLKWIRTSLLSNWLRQSPRVWQTTEVDHWHARATALTQVLHLDLVVGLRSAMQILQCMSHVDCSKV